MEILKKKILVIDDESPIADMIADFCQTYGFETRVLNSGEKAVEVAKAFRPDLITLDIVMPEKSGLEVADLLKNDPETVNIPIIVISSYTNAVEAAKSLQIAQAVLQKPVSLKILEENIGSVLLPKKP